MSRIALAILALMTLASTAQAQRLRVLPPEEYDRPYTDGPIIHIPARDQAQVRELCPRMVFGLGVALGCAHSRGKTCIIVMAPAEVIEAAGHDPMVVLRHERAHCNGWPAHHPGAR